MLLRPVQVVKDWVTLRMQQLLLIVKQREEYKKLVAFLPRHDIKGKLGMWRKRERVIST